MTYAVNVRVLGPFFVYGKTYNFSCSQLPVLDLSHQRECTFPPSFCAEEGRLDAAIHLNSLYDSPGFASTAAAGYCGATILRPFVELGGPSRPNPTTDPRCVSILDGLSVMRCPVSSFQNDRRCRKLIGVDIYL